MGEVQKFYAANAPYIENPNYDKTDPASLPVIPNPVTTPTPNHQPPKNGCTDLKSKPQIMAGIQGMVDQDALQAQLATALQATSKPP